MPAFNPFNVFREDLAKGVHHFNSDTFKVALSNVAPNPDNTVLANISQIANGGGYLAGGYQLDGISVSRTGGQPVVNILGNEEAVTATGGAIAAFRYLIVYNDTATGDPLIGWIDQGESRSYQTDEQFRLRFNPTLGLMTIS